jgi:hypothetical protein
MNMSKKKSIFGILLLAIVISLTAFIRQTEPWTTEQLMAPADLAARINQKDASQPLLICIGPSGIIKGSLEAGPTRDKENLDKLRKLVSKEDRNREVVIYCGCCPFEHCPNVRPAFALLMEMHFTHARLLNLSHNIKKDWIDQGYPIK